MSEENRFIKNKKVIALSISLVIMCILAGTLGISFILSIDRNDELSGDYDDLYIDYLELLNDFNKLDNQYFILTGEYIELENEYNALVLALATITAERDALEIERDGLLLDIIELDNEITNLGIIITNLGTTITGLEGEIITLENVITGLETTITGLNSEIVILTAERDALQIALDNLEDENDALVLYYTELIAGLNSEIGNLIIERDNLVIALADMTVLRDDLQIDLNAMTIERDTLLSDLAIMTAERDNLVIDLGIMTAERDALQIAFDELNADYLALSGDYDILQVAYNELQSTYNALQIAYDYITDTIRQSILPVQYCIFAEAVRRYYMPIYLEGKIGKTYWISFAEYCRDVILHDSWQENSFIDVSNAFSDALIFGNDTMKLADYIMYWTFYPWLPNWYGWDLTGNELTDIDTIVDWCIDEIDYEFDSDIIDGQEYFDWDYIKFPVETAFRTFGDCEDQAILTAAYLESCGFETIIVISHDPSHPTYGAFYHGSLLVHIEDTSAFWVLYPDAYLWNFGGVDPYSEYTWCWLDTTWDVPFGSTPLWLQDYIDFGMITTDIVTLAFCDIDGFIGENLGLTCVMPT